MKFNLDISSNIDYLSEHEIQSSITFSFHLQWDQNSYTEDTRISGNADYLSEHEIQQIIFYFYL
jgi:hypothetical protein